MFCGKCGTENPDDIKYCLKCGADLEKMRTPPPRGRKSIGEKATAGGKVSTTDFRQSIGEMKTVLSDEDIALLFDKGTLISDRYEIKALLGKGGMGVVYQVYDNLLKDNAALKMMLPSLIRTEKAIERFINEAKMSLKLSHENIVRIRDIGEFKGIRYISMEYLEGNTLRQLLAEKKKSGEVFSLSEALRIIFQICDGLSYAHKYTVHRDIKPENIMIMLDGKLKIMDFGIAKLMSTALFTTTSVSMGTAYYMAPEQSIDPTKVDNRADIYSVGVILYEMLTSNIPMGSFQFPHQLDPNLPEEIDDIIEIALRPLPKERYQNIEEFKKDIDGVVSHVPDLSKELKEKPKAIKERLIRRARKAADLETDRIICPICQTINSRDKYFCVNCGENLKVKCPQCQSDVDVDLTYCGKCGVNIVKYREDLISGHVKSAKEHIAKEDFDLAKKEIEKIEAVDRKHPAIAELQNLIKKEKEKLAEIEKLVNSAEELLQQKSYDQAFEQATKVLELEKNHPEALQIVEKVEDIQKEIRKLKEAIDKCLSNLQLNEAISLFEKLVEIKPLDSQWKAELSELQKKLKRVDELKGVAKRLFQNKEYEKALEQISHLNNIIGDDKDIPKLYEDVTTTLKRIKTIEKEAEDNLNSRIYGKALKLYEQLKELKPKDKIIINRINDIKLKAAEEKAKAQRRQLIVALVIIVIAAGIIAVSLSIRAHKQYLQEMDSAYNMAVSLQQDEKYIQAEEKFKQFIAQYPDSKYITDVNRRLDNIKEKIAELKAEENRLMQEADTLFNKRQFSIPADNNAVVKYKQALNINPGNQHAKSRLEFIINFYLQKAQEAYNKGRYLSPTNDNALKYINNILSIESNHLLALNMKKKISAHYEKLADNSWNEKDFTSAKRYYQSLQVVYPEDESIKRKINLCDIEIEQHRLVQLKAQEEAAFNRAKSINTMSSWEEFIGNYPNSEHVLFARNKIKELKEEVDFNRAKSINTISSWEEFIEKYPNSKRIPYTRNKIKELEEEEDLNRAKSDNTISSWEEFIEKYPNSKHMAYAKIKIRGFIDKAAAEDFALSKRIDSLSKWKEFLAKYRRSSYADYAWRRIIDLSPWIMFHHDLRRTGQSPFKGPENPKIKWIVTTGNYIISSPAIGADGTIYVGSNDNKLYAINFDGSRKWAFVTGGDIQSSPAIGADGTIYVGSNDKKLYAINSDGSKKWAFATGDWIRSSPAIGSDGTIYVGSEDGKLYALDPDGSKKWEFKAEVEAYSTPAIGEDGTIYVNCGIGKFYAINPDGSKKWVLRPGSWHISSPAIGADGTIYVGGQNLQGKLYAINSDGSKKWELSRLYPILQSTLAIGSDGTLYVADLKKILAINPYGSKKWEHAIIGVSRSSPAIGADGTIYVGSTSGKLYAINPDGSKKWEFTIGDQIWSSPAIGADGTIYLGSVDGTLYAIGNKY